MAKITYEDKEFLNKNEEIADNRKVNDTDLNEIKQVVNTNDDNIGDLSNLNTTDKSSIVNGINSTLPKILFEGTGDISITLNDNLSSYSRIVIYFKQTEFHNTSYGSVEVDSPNGKNVELSIIFGNVEDSLYICSRCYILSGNRMTKSDGFSAKIYPPNASWGIGDTLRVTKVIGYKD